MLGCAKCNGKVICFVYSYWMIRGWVDLPAPDCVVSCSALRAVTEQPTPRHTGYVTSRWVIVPCVQLRDDLRMGCHIPAHRLQPLIICCTLYAVCVWPDSASPWHVVVSNMTADETFTSKCWGQSETYLALWLNMMRFLQQQKSSIVTTSKGNQRIHETRQSSRQTGTYMSVLNLFTINRTVFFDLCIWPWPHQLLKCSQSFGKHCICYQQGGYLHFIWYFQTLLYFPLSEKVDINWEQRIMLHLILLGR
jgi:hypothetical protein